MEEFKNIEFKAMDIENDEEAEVLVEKYTIKSVPTTILLDENDDLIYKLIGNVHQKDLVNVINQTLNNGETV
jgi:thioredoxin-related protein